MPKNISSAVVEAKIRERALQDAEAIERHLRSTTTGAGIGLFESSSTVYRSDYRDPALVPPLYSSTRKAFTGVVPANTQSSMWASTRGSFRCSRLWQTEVLSVIAREPVDRTKLAGPFDTSISEKLKPIFKSVGLIEDKSGIAWGTCILISCNFALVARHVLENMGDISQLNARFDYYTGAPDPSSKSAYPIICIAEEDVDLDYAIVQLYGSPGLRHGYMHLSCEPLGVETELALLHYPLGKPLKVSVHAPVHTEYARTHLEVFHDTDFGSSGGAYIMPNGQCCAIHLGCQTKETADGFNLHRYALEIARICEKNPKSILQRFDHGFLERNTAYRPTTRGLLKNLDAIDRPFLEVEMRDRRRNRLKAAENGKQIKAAKIRTEKRLKIHNREAYKVMSVRDLATYFAELGPNILDPKNQYFTQSNKTLFLNPSTGCYVCYDKLGEYNTVRRMGHRQEPDINDQYADLNGNWVAQAAVDDRHHFRNTEEPLALTKENPRTRR